MYKHEAIPRDEAVASLTKPSCNLRIIPDVDGSQKRAQLIGYSLCDVELIEAWRGDARLSLFPHVTCPTADLPIRRFVRSFRFVSFSVEIAESMMVVTSKQTSRCLTVRCFTITFSAIVRTKHPTSLTS